MGFTARVERSISAAHHNGPPGSRCRTNHGHDWFIVVEIEYTESELDGYGWGPDFGAVKRVLDAFDHKDLNEIMQEPSSSENFALRIFNAVRQATTFTPKSVEVNEGNGNRVTYTL